MPISETTTSDILVSKPLDQACAIPFRRAGKRLEFCLISSSAGNWKFPKGYIDAGETFVETALKEAQEEAGLHGRIIGEPLGYYEITKKRRVLTVVAALMEVTKCDMTWEEADVRQRCWKSTAGAHKLISEPDLHELLDVAIKRISEN